MHRDLIIQQYNKADLEFIRVKAKIARREKRIRISITFLVGGLLLTCLASIIAPLAVVGITFVILSFMSWPINEGDLADEYIVAEHNYNVALNNKIEKGL